MAKKTSPDTSEPTVESTAANETGTVDTGTPDVVDSSSGTAEASGSDASADTQPDAAEIAKTSEPTVESTVPPVKTGSLKVKNTILAGKTLYGVTGKPIYFNEEGIAEPVAADYEHLLKVPGYEKA
jgi:hypothetical protein